MDTIAFNAAIQEFFRLKYGVEYTHPVEVTYDSTDGRYTYQMILNQRDRPITFSGQYDTMELFLAFVLKELTARALPIGMDYFNLIQTGPSTNNDNSKAF